VHSRSTPFLRTISCEIPKEDYNSKACRIYIGCSSLAGTSYARIHYSKAPSIQYHPTFCIILLCLSASLGVHSALSPNHDSSPNSCNSTQVGGTTDAGESSQHNGYRHVVYYVVSTVHDAQTNYQTTTPRTANDPI
jgi:hypothetical protein